MCILAILAITLPLPSTPVAIQYPSGPTSVVDPTTAITIIVKTPSHTLLANLHPPSTPGRIETKHKTDTIIKDGVAHFCDANFAPVPCRALSPQAQTSARFPPVSAVPDVHLLPHR